MLKIVQTLLLQIQNNTTDQLSMASCQVEIAGGWQQSGQQKQLERRKEIVKNNCE